MQRARAAGIHLHLRGTKVHATGTRQPDPQLLADLRTHRAAIVDQLTLQAQAVTLIRHHFGPDVTEVDERGRPL